MRKLYSFFLFFIVFTSGTLAQIHFDFETDHHEDDLHLLLRVSRTSVYYKSKGYYQISDKYLDVDKLSMVISYHDTLLGKYFSKPESQSILNAYIDNKHWKETFDANNYTGGDSIRLLADRQVDDFFYESDSLLRSAEHRIDKSYCLLNVTHPLYIVQERKGEQDRFFAILYFEIQLKGNTCNRYYDKSATLLYEKVDGKWIMRKQLSLWLRCMRSYGR